MIRINDTRLYHEASFSHFIVYIFIFEFLTFESHILKCFNQAGQDYMLREFSTRESKISDLQVS